MFLVPSDPASQPVVESLVSAIDAKSRRLFTSLNKEKLITIVSMIDLFWSWAPLFNPYTRQKMMLSWLQQVPVVEEEGKANKRVLLYPSHYL